MEAELMSMYLMMEMIMVIGTTKRGVTPCILNVSGKNLELLWLVNDCTMIWANELQFLHVGLVCIFL